MIHPMNQEEQLTEALRAFGEVTVLAPMDVDWKVIVTPEGNAPATTGSGTTKLDALKDAHAQVASKHS